MENREYSKEVELAYLQGKLDAVTEINDRIASALNDLRTASTPVEAIAIGLQAIRMVARFSNHLQIQIRNLSKT